MNTCKGVLIVEDDQDIRESIKDYLELEGYKTHLASNGAEALTVLAGLKEPCLILLDLMMPIMNGWEFIEAKVAKPELADIPVIVVSAAGDEMPKPKAIHGFVKKPIDLTALFDVVRNYCGTPPIN